MDVAIYGWSLGPIYTSGHAAWPITDPVFARLYDPARQPFWSTEQSGDARHRVHFSSDRVFIYAIGYPTLTLFDHLVHLAELTTLSGAVYVLVLLGTALFTRVARGRPRLGRALLREIRASFYRKLFLAFVLASIIPVLALALWIRTYFANLLTADVAREAARTAAVAQRVIEQSSALLQRTDGLESASDDVMVWIRQVIDQDVNIFSGAELVATSERDLFESGVLATRTPDAVYRAIALEQLASFVGEDRIGNIPYTIAASPVRAGEQKMILTVPLANRQRDIDREIDDLDRGVHLAALVFVLLGAAMGLYMAERIADPVRRLTRATRRIARGDFDAQIAVKSADELRRLVDAFNSMAAELKAQRAQLERTHRLEAWAEMARQVAHEIKNPLTPIQLSAEHLRRVHADRGEPLGDVVESCVNSILGQVRLLRRISAEFSSFASSPTARPAPVDVPELVAVVDRSVPHRPVRPHRDRQPRRRRRSRASSSTARSSPAASPTSSKTRSMRCPARACSRSTRPPTRTSSRCAFATPASAWTPTRSRACSSRTSQPRRPAPAWGCPSRAATSNSTAGRSRSKARRVRGRWWCCGCRSPAPATPLTRHRSTGAREDSDLELGRHGDIEKE